MILGIGNDIVVVSRFSRWTSYSRKRLQGVFSEQELCDCFENPTQKKTKLSLVEQRLASRFAAKEAFYKAFSSMLMQLDIDPEQQFSLLFTCKQVQVIIGKLGVPALDINWEPLVKKIGQTIPSVSVLLSLAHEKDMALAFVVISKK